MKKNQDSLINEDKIFDLKNSVNKLDSLTPQDLLRTAVQFFSENPKLREQKVLCKMHLFSW